LNEAPTLGELFERTKATLGGIGKPFEFIVVDDGSTDDTPAVTRKLLDDNPNVIVIRHARNFGKSVALMQAFENASGNVLVTLDGDLQDKPEMIPRLLNEIEAGADLVGGLRVRRHDNILKRFISRLYNNLVSRIFKSPLKDVNSGLKAMRRDVYKSLELHGDQHRLIPILATLKGFNCTETPVEHDARRVGQSRYSLLRHRGILDVIALIAVNAAQIRPFHFFCEVAFVFWVLAAASFTGWVFSVVGVPADGAVTWRVVGNLLVGVGAWAAFTGTVLPLFGLFMEVEIRRYQDKVWRSRLATVIRSKQPS
jgi:glycosyltransferase involved in cell wall biosynthesis